MKRVTREKAADRALGDKLHRATLRTVEKREHLVDELPEWEELRRRAREIRLDALDRHEKLLDRFKRRLEERGATVTIAATGEAAAAHIAALAREAGSPAIKSKSMTSEEVGLNAALERAGVRVTETDLGEWIVQQARQAPSHITAPAIHLSVEDIARIFRDAAGVPLPAWVERGETVGEETRQALARELSLTARRILRARFLEARVGITGANFLVAESGTIVLLENEGNIRLTTCLPQRQIVLAGIDKLIPREEDLAVLLRLLPISATGQRQSGYVSLLADRHQDLHVVLLDNGRSTLLRDAEQRDLLTCIRCGACMNACPVYRCVGGHAYGGVYPGPIGALLLPHLGGFARYADLPFASSLCGACSEACPVGIPLHERLLQLRARMVRLGLARELGTSFRVATSAMRRARRMERGLSLYRFARPFLGSLPVARRWAAERELPAPAAETFRTWWRRNRPASTPPPDAQAGSTGSAGRAAAPETSPEAGPRPVTRLRSTDAVRKDPVALFTRRLAELGPEGETEFRQYARGDEVRAFLAARLAGIAPRDILVAGEEPEKREYQAGITDAAALIADTAGVVLDLRRRDFATASLLVDTHYVVAHPSRLVPDLPAFFRLRAEKRLRGDWHDLQVIATGPSRTADIEKTLVIPAHGPRRLVVVLCEEPISVADLRPRT